MITIKSRFATGREQAFTLAEVMFSVGMLGIIAAGGVQGLLRMNNNAALSRLQTGASTVAQNRIDLILSDSPFNPQKGQIPPVLQPGTQNLGSGSAPIVPIYTDPASGEVSVSGWMTSTVTDTATVYKGQDMNLYRARVAVHYRFRGRIYSVTMNTVRASDI